MAYDALSGRPRTPLRNRDAQVHNVQGNKITYIARLTEHPDEAASSSPTANTKPICLILYISDYPVQPVQTLGQQTTLPPRRHTPTRRYF